MSQIALNVPVGPALPHLPQHWAHDIRNVLATIAVRLNTLESLSGPAGSRAAESIHDLISRVRALCDQAAAHSRDGFNASKRRKVQITSAVEQVPSIVLPTAPQGFQIEISGSTRLSALIDPTDLFRIVFNFFHNAVTVAQEKGGLSIIRVHVGEVGERIFVDISDNGPGLPACVKKQLFRPSPRRFGLKLRGFGLLIARELAERNGGSLKFLETNGGAHFRVRLVTSAVPLGRHQESARTSQSMQRH
jgi:C4-dicarboxylate-specific signal transduction histidine kinase